MTATPIPRTLGPLSVHGDLEVWFQIDGNCHPRRRSHGVYPTAGWAKSTGRQAYQLIRQQGGPWVCGLMWVLALV